ncbi:MAG: hypothetical protein ACK5Q5_18720 [Planctomycetaceae bacterium]
MTVTLKLPEDLEHALNLHAADSGEDVAAVVQQIVRERLEADAASATKAALETNFRASLQNWIDRLPSLETVVDDSREVIYAGRGE